MPRTQNWTNNQRPQVGAATLEVEILVVTTAIAVAQNPIEQFG